MFRITSHVRDGEVLLKVEGFLAGACVHELDVLWREAMTSSPEGRVRVDLTDVCRVDREGRELMTVMYRAGVRYAARGCVVPELVREIAQSADASRGN
jgi:hypothetical protein